VPLLADRMASTSADRACLQAVRELSGATDGPMERHNTRVALIAERMAQARGIDADGELLRCAAHLHDLGLYPGAATEEPYVADGARLARELLEPLGWAPERVELCAQAVERHHELRPQWSRGAEVELIRRADRVDVLGLAGPGSVPRGWLRGLFRAVPRRGLYPEIGRLVARSARDRPGSLAGTFVRPGS
jgi:HD domain-containing protein